MSLKVSLPQSAEDARGQERGGDVRGRLLDRGPKHVHDSGKQTLTQEHNPLRKTEILTQCYHKKVFFQFYFDASKN